MTLPFFAAVGIIKKERKIIGHNCIGWILHLFSGKSIIGDIRVDFKYGNMGIDVFEYLKDIDEIKKCNFKTIIIDAPYNQRFADKYQEIGRTPKQFIIFGNAKKTTELFDRIIEISPVIIILKSWNYYCLKGYEIKKCYICYPRGYRKSTFLIIMKKINTEV